MRSRAARVIETAALNTIRERQFLDDIEMAQINDNEALMERLRAGSSDARKRKGRFVD